MEEKSRLGEEGVAGVLGGDNVNIDEVSEELSCEPSEKPNRVSNDAFFNESSRFCSLVDKHRSAGSIASDGSANGSTLSNDCD